MALANLLGDGTGQFLRGTKSSKGPWLQVSSNPQSTHRVVCGPPGELRGRRGLSPDFGTVAPCADLFQLHPTVPSPRLGANRQYKLGEGKTHSSPGCAHLSTCSFSQLLRPRPCRSSVTPVISTSRPSADPGSSTFKTFPEPAFALSSLPPPLSCLLLSPIWRVTQPLDCLPAPCP